jgi:hypothetical protein
MYGVADRRSYGVVLEERLGQAYNEQAFRYLLEIERQRAARAHRPVLLLLLDAKEPLETGADMDPVLAGRESIDVDVDVDDAAGVLDELDPANGVARRVDECAVCPGRAAGGCARGEHDQAQGRADREGRCALRHLDPLRGSYHDTSYVDIS